MLDLVKHEQEWAREKWADLWLGFEAGEVTAWMEQAGLAPIHTGQHTGTTRELAVLTVVGRKK